MNANQQLARQQNDRIAIAQTQLKPQEKCLLVELALTAENAKTELSPELQAEFLREFGDAKGESLQESFRRWRARSSFIPSTAEIREIIGRIAEEARFTREARAREAEKADREEALRYWAEHPEERDAWISEMRQLEEKLSIAQSNNLQNQPPRSPRNMLALSQAKVLGHLKQPPKKQPKPITDSSPAQLRVAKAAKN